MGASGLGPFDNDCALDFIDEFIEVESPIRSIRAALSQLDKDCYHQVDDVYQAWAACELVAIVSSGGKGYDPDDTEYEAASRLRPNKKLVQQCLATLKHVLDKNSELSELIDAKQRVGVESNIARTRACLEQGLALDKFPRLKVPKIKAMHTYAIAACGKWLVALFNYSNLIVLDTVLEAKPESVDHVSIDEMSILFNCRYLGPIDDFEALGRVRPPKAITESNEYVTITRYGCSSGSNFETNYLLHRGRELTKHHYNDIQGSQLCPEFFPTQFMKVVNDFVATGSLSFPRVPTPTELRDEYLERCQKEWARYLKGDGGGPFSFPRIYETDVSQLIAPWIKLHLRADWTNSGMCLPEDLFRYFLAGVVAASIGALPENELPAKLVPTLEPLKATIGHPEISAAIHVLSCVLDEASVIPHVLRNDPPRQKAFFDCANALREALTAKLAT